MSKKITNALYEILRKERQQIARKNELPPWWCSNDLLKIIVRHRPSSLENLKSIEGIKPRHIKHGEPFIDAIKKFCDANKLEMNIFPRKRKVNVEKLEEYQQRIKSTIGSFEDVDMDLYRKLQNLRLRLARELSRGRSRIFHNVAIRDMARHRPSNKKNFLKIHMVGQKKFDEFGDIFIQEIVDYCSRKKIETDVGF